VRVIDQKITTHIRCLQKDSKFAPVGTVQ
jgi:hypothetical protein